MLVDGYSMCIHEYTNDMSAREMIEQNRSHPMIAAHAAEIAKIDAKVIELLRPTKKCIHGDYPRSHFWFWMYPPSSPELEKDLRAINAI